MFDNLPLVELNNGLSLLVTILINIWQRMIVLKNLLIFKKYKKGMRDRHFIAGCFALFVFLVSRDRCVVTGLSAV